jgi:hypothetical protein
MSVALGGVACGGAQSDTSSSTTEADTSASVAPCTLNVWVPGPDVSGPQGMAVANCGWNYKGGNEQIWVRSCLQQLVTGGWETIAWTCKASWSPAYGTNFVDSGSVPYLTAGRWYRTFGTMSLNGTTVHAYSLGCQGNGGDSCR